VLFFTCMTSGRHAYAAMKFDATLAIQIEGPVSAPPHCDRAARFATASQSFHIPNEDARASIDGVG